MISRHLLPVFFGLSVSVFAGMAQACPLHEAEAKTSVSAYQSGMQRMHQDMDITYSGDVDTDFVRGMIPHHQGAIDMADVVLKFGKDEAVAKLARFIKASQEAEIGMMQQWLRREGAEEPAQDVDSIGTRALKASMEMMHRDMNIVYSGDADQDFVCGMIPHHQGAIEMARAVLDSGRDPEIAELARSIITSQSSDIATMNRWLKWNNITCSLAAAAHRHH